MACSITISSVPDLPSINCDPLKELVLAISGVVLDRSVIPALVACISLVAAGSVSNLAGLIALTATDCEC